MATRGIYLMQGYLPGKGMVKAYQDTSNPKFLFCDAVGSDDTYYVARSRVQPRKTASKPSVAAEAKASEEQPTLF